MVIALRRCVSQYHNSPGAEEAEERSLLRVTCAILPAVPLLDR